MSWVAGAVHRRQGGFASTLAMGGDVGGEDVECTARDMQCTFTLDSGQGTDRQPFRSAVKRVTLNVDNCHSSKRHRDSEK